MSVDVRSRESLHRTFLWYLAGTILFAIPVAHMFSSMWTAGAHSFFTQVLDLPFVPASESSIQVAVMAASGVYLAWMLLFANDWRKRYQGYILIAASILTTAVLAIQGIGIPNIDFSSPINLLALVIGFAVGVGSERDVRNVDVTHSETSWAHLVLLDEDRETPAEFPIAYQGLIVFLLLVLFGGNVMNFIYNSSFIAIIVHGLASLGLGYFLFGFLDLQSVVSKTSREAQESNENPMKFEVLGPQQSGKTYLALGIHLTISRNNAFEYDDFNGKIIDLVNEHAQSLNRTPSGLVDFGIGNTAIDNAEDLEINFKRVDSFGDPIRASINMFDYPGEVLEDVSAMLTEGRNRAMTDGGDPGRENGSPTGDADSDDRSGEHLTVGDIMGESFEEMDSNETEETEADQEEAIHLGPQPEEEAPNQDSVEMDGEEQTEGPKAKADLRDEVTNKLIQNITEADKLVILLDSERFVVGEAIFDNDPGMMIPEMTRIAKNAPPEDILLVATKADHFLDEFEGLDHDEEPTKEQFKKFRSHVEERFHQDQTVELLSELADRPIFPVHYLTGQDSDGARKLKVDEGNVEPIGYDRLLEALVDQ